MRLGEVPPKRHTQLWRDGRLLTEQVMGMEGFSGNYSILYHLQTPCRVMSLGGFVPIEKDEWVPEQHQHISSAPPSLRPSGDVVGGRRLLMWNDDVEIWFCRPAEARTRVTTATGKATRSSSSTRRRRAGVHLR